MYSFSYDKDDVVNTTKVHIIEGLQIVNHIRTYNSKYIKFDGIVFSSYDDFNHKPVHNQEKVRELMLNKYREIKNNKSVTLRLPDYFALFILLIAPRDVTSYQKAIEGCVEYRPQCREYHTYKCACSHDIQHIYYFGNTITKITLIVGSCCVKKTKIPGIELVLKEEKKKEKNHINEKVVSIKNQIDTMVSIYELNDMETNIKSGKIANKNDLIGYIKTKKDKLTKCKFCDIMFEPVMTKYKKKSVCCPDHWKKCISCGDDFEPLYISKKNNKCYLCFKLSKYE